MRLPGLQMLCLSALCVAGGVRAAPAGGARAPAPGREPLRIELRPEVQVKGPQVLLGEVAVLTTTDLGLLERLMILPLGPAPRSGTPVRLERAALVRWIRARTGLRAEQIAWSGPEAAALRTEVTHVRGEELASKAAEALAQAIDAQGLGLEVGPPVIPVDQEVPAGEVELRPRSIPRAALRSGRPSVWVDLWVDGRFARTVPVRFELTSNPAAPTAGAPVPRVRVARVPAPVHAAVPSAPAVQRGGSASLRSVVGRISVESRVEVLEDGRPGEVVRVRLPGADAPVLARVIAPRAVEVEP